MLVLLNSNYKFKLLIIYLFIFVIKNNTFADESLVVSSGQRISLPDKGFSIIPPAGWSIDKDFSGVSLLLKPPIEDVKIKRTLQVMRFSGPLYIDAESAHKFFRKTKKKFEALNSGVKNYKMRNYTFVKTKAGASAVLLYVDYLLSDRHMMQAHLLVSSKKKYFVMTYTDTEESISSVSLGYREAWDAMISIKLPNYIGSRYATYYYFVAFFFLLGLIFLFFYLKKRNLQDQELTVDDDELLS